MKMRWWIVLAPFLIYYGGIGLNLLAEVTNHGQMPVVLSDWTTERELNFHHAPLTKDTHLKILCDWIPIWWLGEMMSLGDAFMGIGEWIQPYMIGAWIGLLIYRRGEY
jgi:hypothetical protein